MSLRGEIFKARVVARPQAYGSQVEGSLEWMVVFTGAGRRPKHGIEEKRDWAGNHGPLCNDLPDSVWARMPAMRNSQPCCLVVQLPPSHFLDLC